jgi:hypothetical protein
VCVFVVTVDLYRAASISKYFPITLYVSEVIRCKFENRINELTTLCFVSFVTVPLKRCRCTALIPQLNTSPSVVGM